MNKWTLIIAAVLVVLFLARKPIINTVVDMAQTFSRSSFINTFSDIVRESSRDTGLFPSVFMAQAILESGNGNSSLSKKAYNFFGIKADKSWDGEIYTVPTKEYVNGKEVTVTANFRKYSAPLFSFLDRVQFLIDNPRYKNNGVFSAKTPEEQAQALQRAGYATDPNYANLLIKLINQNNLKKLDS